MTVEVRKICMLGDFAVGKTSLVNRFVRQAFDQRYLSTVGVKIDTKLVQVADRQVKLVLWDLAGSDPLNGAAHNYLVGTHGVVLVADGTRPETLDSALRIHHHAESLIGARPTVLLINKADLEKQWCSTRSDLVSARLWALNAWETSALTGVHVEEAFLTLAGVDR